MSNRIAPLAIVTAEPSAGPAATEAGALHPGQKTQAEKVKKVAQEFEAMLVRQMLGQTKLGGGGTYGSMAVDALAGNLTAGPGLGFARALEQSINDSLAAQKKGGG
jgi:Rod binding domain-containing protein